MAQRITMGDNRIIYFSIAPCGFLTIFHLKAIAVLDELLCDYKFVFLYLPSFPMLYPFDIKITEGSIDRD